LEGYSGWFAWSRSGGRPKDIPSEPWLGCRWDKILQSPELDLDALAQLVADYEAADLIYTTADLRRRLEWYRGKEKSEPET
jgi:hypothetical protein